MEEKHLCPVCGQYEFEEYSSYDICEVCGWEDDAVQEKYPDLKGGANRMSLMYMPLGLPQLHGVIAHPRR